MLLSTILLALPLALASPVVEGRSVKVPGKWIVTLKDGASDSALEKSVASVTKILGKKPNAIYNLGDFKGFAVQSKTLSLLDPLRKLTEIASIEPDLVRQIQVITRQQNPFPPYNLAKISHKQPNPAEDYVYDSSAGAGTIAFGIDTGIMVSHKDFEGRASFGRNFVGGANTDENGHGTHTAGTIGSKTYGVAKKTKLIAVKVLDGNGTGSDSGIISGVQYAVNEMTRRNAVGKAVANLSLGGLGISGALNSAVAAAVKKGLFVSVAAGNDMLPAALFSPASVDTACVVGATDKNNQFASFSNFGPPVDILAPGVDIVSTWNLGPHSTETLSGTSMSAPVISGLGAYLLTLEGKRNPVALCERLKSLSSKNAVGFVPLGTPNQLAYNGVKS